MNHAVHLQLCVDVDDLDRDDCGGTMGTVVVEVVTITADRTSDHDDLEHAIFRSFVRFFRSFLRFLVRSKILQKIVRVNAIHLVRKSSKSELSSRFFGRSGF